MWLKCTHIEQSKLPLISQPVGTSVAQYAIFHPQNYSFDVLQYSVSSIEITADHIAHCACVGSIHTSFVDSLFYATGIIRYVHWTRMSGFSSNSTKSCLQQLTFTLGAIIFIQNYDAINWPGGLNCCTELLCKGHGYKYWSYVPWTYIYEYVLRLLGLLGPEKVRRVSKGLLEGFLHSESSRPLEQTATTHSIP